MLTAQLKSRPVGKIELYMKVCNAFSPLSLPMFFFSDYEV